ncbi:MAG: putative enoyl-CoA hydratase echA8 [Pelotomaculum sp. PtaB.Bin104]|nr:MAG: putative enoyl-CoA hydratase echA8 [Pelotomaculum sp. PtaB.Bin104]
MFNTIIYKVSGSVAYITLNRPEAMNSLDPEILLEMLEALKASHDDQAVRAVVITGAGKAFCAGGDLKWMMSVRNNDWKEKFDCLVRDFNTIILYIRGIEKPVIAAVNGFASGAGFSLALACDVRVVSENAKFNQAYVKIGLTPDGGSSFFLTKMLGPARATDLIFTGRMVGAQEALALGLASEVVPAGSFSERIEQVAKKFAAGPPLSYEMAKTLINEALGPALEAQLDYERDFIVSASLSNDFEEGLTAFINKREPVFKGN